MDTPESPTQSPQSPDEEEKGFSDSELLGSPDSPAENNTRLSDSELLKDEDEEGQREDSDLEEDGVKLNDLTHAPEDISDQEDERPNPDESPHPSRPAQEILQTPQSPDPDFSEHEQPRTPNEGEQEDFRPEAAGGVPSTRSRMSDEDEEEERRRRRLLLVSELKEESPSVSRDLDEHELDYDEEVPEEPSTAAPDDEDQERGAADEDEEEKEEEEKSRKSERKPILPPDSTDPQPTRSEDQRGQERSRRDSLREKKKDEDDGELDEGEIDDDDLEEGEVKDPTDRKVRPRPICRFFMKGNCTWGMICRFIHPGVNDKGNYSLIAKPDPFSPNGVPPGGGGPAPLMPNNPWGVPPVEELPPPPLPVEPPVESAWERGLRHAKEVLKKATMRKEQEPDFEEKRFNVTIGEDEWDFDKENEFFRERGYRITREIRDSGEMDFRDPMYGEPHGDPYFDYEMEALWRGGQYENFRVQYTETPLPYHYSDRERERDPRERHRERDRERDRDNRERERRQRERERERERERDKERVRRKDDWERDRPKREDKEGRPRERPPREPRDKKEEKDRALKARSPVNMPARGPMEAAPKKDAAPMVKRPDEWKDPWRRSKSPRRKPGLMGSPPRGRRRHRPSGSSVSLSNSSRSSSRSSSYTGSGSSRSRSGSHSSSLSSYSSHSSQHSSFTGSRSRSRSYSSSASPLPPAQRNAGKTKAEQPPAAVKGHPVKPGPVPVPRRDKPPAVTKKVPSPVMPSKPVKPPVEVNKPPNVREGARPPPPREPGKPPNVREGRRKERRPHGPRRRTLSGSVSGSGSSFTGSSSRSRSSSGSHSRSGSHKSRSLSVSSVSSESSQSSSSSSVRSADSDDMYADLASPVSSASSRSPTPGHVRKERGPARERDTNKERGKPAKKDEAFKDDRKRADHSGLPPKSDSGMPRSGPGNRGHPVNAPPVGSAGGYGSHKDIKLTLLNKQVDRSNRKRYFPADKDRPTSPVSKRAALSPDRGRDRRPGRSPPSPRPDRSRGQVSRPMPPHGDRKRPMSPPAKSSGRGVTGPMGKPPAPAAGSGSGSGKTGSTLSRREELLKQLKAVEDAIARKRAKIPGK